MLKLVRENPRAFVYALMVHLALLAILVFSLDWRPATAPASARQSAPIKAVAIDAGEVDAEIKRQRQIEEAQQRKERERLQRLERQAAQARRVRQREEKRLAELKRKQVEARRQAKIEAEKRAEARRKAEQEARRKAEAERKARAEAERKAEARRKAEAEAKRQAELAAKRKAEAERRAAAERRRKAEEAARRKAAEAALQASLAAEREQLVAQRRQAMQRMVDEYVLYIKEKVQRSWIKPPASSAGLACLVQVRLIPSGEVIDVRIIRSSGDAAFDRSVETAVFKASPLPVPPDPEVMNSFRSLRFEFKPG